jgi:hypothetical protein
VLALSDAGGPATTALMTDYPTKVDCERVAAVLSDTAPETTLGGRRIFIKVKTFCAPTGPPPPVVYGPGPPLPIAGIINGILGFPR